MRRGFKDMKKGFTIIELLVASMLLGMLVTILTMVFNQSSIAWRTGMAGTQDMDRVRENVAEIREEADNAFVHGNELHRILGLWDETGKLRTRACDAGTENQTKNQAAFLNNNISGLSNLRARNFQLVMVGATEDGGASKKTYTVNVKSDGPDGEPNTWDDVWSWPDQWD